MNNVAKSFDILAINLSSI